MKQCCSSQMLHVLSLTAPMSTLACVERGAATDEVRRARMKQISRTYLKIGCADR